MSTLAEVTQRVADRRARISAAGLTVSAEQLAEELNLHPESVARWRRRLRITEPARPLPPRAERIARARLLAEVGESSRTIATLCHLDRLFVQREFPETVWTREMMNEASGLRLRFRKMRFPRPRYLPAEPDDREEDR